MKKRNIKGNLIKILITLMCVFSLTIAMPKKSEAGFWDYVGGKVVSTAYDLLDGIVGDFVNLILWIPDGVLHLVDEYVAGIEEPVRFKIEKKEYIYNFGVTPYEIFKSGVYEHVDDGNGGYYITKMGLLDINFFSNDFVKSERAEGIVISKELAPAISKVYSNIRNLCIIIMMLVLMYIGIRIMISSIAEQQAKYKQLLLDWLVAFSLLFIMHYIMSFIVNINYVVIEMLCNNEGDSYYIADDSSGKIKDISNSKWESNSRVCTNLDGSAYEFVNDYLAAIDVNTSMSTTNSGDPIEVEKWGNNGVVPISLVILDDEDNDIKRVFKMNTLSYVRTVSYASLRNKDDDEDEHKVYLMGDGKITQATDLDAMGYSILYVVLMIEIVMFIVIYVKRVIQLAFLTMIAPLVAFMYPIDKIGDGKAQAFNSWFKDYLFGVLIQPMHLLLYTVFIRAAGSLLSNNIVYALAIYAYMIPAEKYFKKILGFEKGSSGVGMGGPLAGALGAGLALGGLNKIAGIGPGGKGGSGKGKSDPRKHKIRKLKPVGAGTPSSAGGGASSGLGGRLTPGAAGRGRAGARGPLAPGASGAAANRNRKPRLGGIPGALGSTIGRGISGALTGGKYESMSGYGPKAAALKNLTGKGFRGAAKLIGATTGAATGLIAGTASAIVNGREGDILTGLLTGTAAGYKQFGNAAGSITSGLDNLSNTFVTDLAARNDWVAEKVRVSDALAQFAPDLADMSSTDREKYERTLRQTAAYVNFSSMDDVKAMTKALEASGNDSAAAVDAYNAARNFGKLDVQHNKEAFMSNPEILKQANAMAGGIAAPTERKASDYSDSDVAAEFTQAKRLRTRQLEKAKAELDAKLDKELNEARSENRKRAIAAEHRKQVQELNASMKSDAELLAEAKRAKADTDNAAAMQAYADQLQPQLDILYNRALTAQGELQK